MSEIIVKSEKDLEKVKAGDVIIFQLEGVDKALQSEDPFDFEEFAKKEGELLDLVNERLKKEGEISEDNENLAIPLIDGLSAKQIKDRFKVKENRAFADHLGIKWRGMNEGSLSELIYEKYNGK